MLRLYRVSAVIKGRRVFEFIKAVSPKQAIFFFCAPPEKGGRGRGWRGVYDIQAEEEYPSRQMSLF